MPYLLISHVRGSKHTEASSGNNEHALGTNGQDLCIILTTGHVQRLIINAAARGREASKPEAAKMNGNLSGGRPSPSPAAYGGCSV